MFITEKSSLFYYISTNDTIRDSADGVLDQQSTMEHSAQQWATELTHVSEDLSHVAHRMQVFFANASEQSIAKGGGPIPDPVKLLRRLAALENRMEQLRSNCLDVAERRDGIVMRVSEAQLRNAETLEELSSVARHLSIDPEELVSVREGDEQMDLNGLLSAVAMQHELFSSK